jgi:protein-S-isoprenylcysteine O-methyltransferase Ste14
VAGRAEWESAVISTLVAYGLVGCFLVLERLTRQGQEAKSLEFGPFDRGSTRLLGVAFLAAVLTLLAAPALNAIPLGAMGWPAVGWVGIGLMVGGIALRFWATRALGRFYTRTLRAAGDQPVIDRGPYKVLRHPGYSGVLVMWAGAGLATLNGIAATAVVVGMCGAYGYRIRREEEMLRSALGRPYETYMQRTWRLVPFVY